MKYQYKITKNNIVFSKWTRKSYAVFASLSKLVNIARLSIDIFKSFIYKIRYFLVTKIVKQIITNINTGMNKSMITRFMTKFCNLTQ
jgi:hypothetical protein